MRCVLVSGFLGSGKTTFVTAMAKQLVENYGRKVIIVVNDVGQVGIDNQYMKRLNTDVFELFGGCICCQLGNDLLALLEEIKNNYTADFILMEASGVAEPNKIMDMIYQYGSIPVKVITLADATRWMILQKALAPLLRTQVSVADFVLVNKVDQSTPEIIQQVCESICEYNNRAKTFRLSVRNEDDVRKMIQVIDHEW